MFPLHPDEAVLLESAAQAADAICTQLERLAGDHEGLAMLLELARHDREALILLQDAGDASVAGAPRRLAVAEAVLADLRDISAAVAAQLREVASQSGDVARDDCDQGRTRRSRHRAPGLPPAVAHAARRGPSCR